MSTPLDNNALTFFLRFNNDNSFGEIEITEAVKYDGATFILEQEEFRYGRDVSFMNESIDLYFYKGYYDPTDNPLILPNGVTVFNLTMGFEHLLESRNTDGFESDIVFGTKKNGVEFIFGNLDFEFSETDDYSYLSCKVVQNTDKQSIKRKSEIKVDVFSDEDLDGETITPLTTTSFLQQAKPIDQISVYENTTPFAIYYPGATADNIEVFTNPFNVTTQYQIEDTISFLDRAFQLSASSTNDFIFTKRYNMGVIDTKNELSNTVIYIKDFTFSVFIPVGGDINSGWGTSANTLQVTIFRTATGNTNSGSFNLEGTSLNLTPVFIGTENVDRFNLGLTGNADRYDCTITNAEIPIEDTGNDIRVSLFFQLSKQQSIQEYKTGELTIKTTSTAINSVIEGVRYIDLFKQVVKSINGFEVVAPRFDVGGEFYDQFTFNGNLIKRRNESPFYNSFKDLAETLREVNADYQIINDKVYIGLYDDFYPNKETAALLSYPDASAKRIFNSRYALNQLNYTYSNYEKEDTEDNTTDSTHTSSQFTFPNKQVEKSFNVTLRQVRDPYLLEKTRKEAFKATTATDNDNKLYIIDAVKLDPGTGNTFSKILKHNYNSETGHLELLNDNSFSWDLLGFNIGSTISILNTGNVGDYEVFAYTSNKITLIGGTFTNLIGTLTTIEYLYDNVLWTNRTNEGFTEISNLLNSTNFSNLKYTIKRNLKYFYSYFATVCKYSLNGVFRNSEFINNGDLITRFGDETVSTKENENVNVVDFGEPILSADKYETRLVVDYEIMIDLLNAVNTINDDNSIGGFVRTLDNNGKVIKLYPSKLEYEPANETLTLTGEVRNESSVLKIHKQDSLIYVDEVGYDLNTSLEWYEITDDYLVIYDNNNVPITNPYRYDKVSVSGYVSGSSIELFEKLIELE